MAAWSSNTLNPDIFSKSASDARMRAAVKYAVAVSMSQSRCRASTSCVACCTSRAALPTNSMAVDLPLAHNADRGLATTLKPAMHNSNTMPPNAIQMGIGTRRRVSISFVYGMACTNLVRITVTLRSSMSTSKCEHEQLNAGMSETHGPTSAILERIERVCDGTPGPLIAVMGSCMQKQDMVKAEYDAAVSPLRAEVKACASAVTQYLSEGHVAAFETPDGRVVHLSTEKRTKGPLTPKMFLTTMGNLTQPLLRHKMEEVVKAHQLAWSKATSKKRKRSDTKPTKLSKAAQLQAMTSAAERMGPDAILHADEILSAASDAVPEVATVSEGALAPEPVGAPVPAPEAPKLTAGTVLGSALVKLLIDASRPLKTVLADVPAESRFRDRKKPVTPFGMLPPSIQDKTNTWKRGREAIHQAQAEKRTRVEDIKVGLQECSARLKFILEGLEQPKIQACLNFVGRDAEEWERNVVATLVVKESIPRFTVKVMTQLIADATAHVLGELGIADQSPEDFMRDLHTRSAVFSQIMHQTLKGMNEYVRENMVRERKVLFKRGVARKRGDVHADGADEDVDDSDEDVDDADEDADDDEDA